MGPYSPISSASNGGGGTGWAAISAAFRRAAGSLSCSTPSAGRRCRPGGFVVADGFQRVGDAGKVGLARWMLGGSMPAWRSRRCRGRFPARRPGRPAAAWRRCAGAIVARGGDQAADLLARRDAERPDARARRAGSEVKASTAILGRGDVAPTAAVSGAVSGPRIRRHRPGSRPAAAAARCGSPSVSCDVQHRGAGQGERKLGGLQHGRPAPAMGPVSGSRIAMWGGPDGVGTGGGQGGERLRRRRRAAAGASGEGKQRGHRRQ